MKGLSLLKLIMPLANIINLFMPVASIVNPNCNYYQDVQVNMVYYIYNPGYPGNYVGGDSCQWNAQSDRNSKIVISCETINIPPSANCASDALAVSLSGDNNLNDAHRYCGNGTLSLVSEANRLAVGFVSVWNSPGGRFLCRVTAIQTGEPTSPPPPTSQCDCGWKQQRRIVGGIETGVNEYPAMAALIDLLNRNLYCGASIISQRYALTAAHCVTNRRARGLGLLVGDHDVDVGSDTSAAALYVLDTYRIHPEYINTTMQNDIAVVRTQELIAFSLSVGPICLPFRYTTANFVGIAATALGWGTTEFSGPKSNTLQAVNLTVISNRDCTRQIQSSSIFYTQICTFTPNKDTCQSDSGGPLYVFDQTTGRLLQIGIISYGLACATDLPGINTRVTSYLDWIVSTTTDAEYCIK